MEIGNEKITVNKEIENIPEHEASHYIQDDCSFLQNLANLFSSSSPSLLELNLELGSVQWNSLTAQQQQEYIIGALKGKNFQSAIENFVNNGASEYFTKLKILVNGSVIGTTIDFALKTTYNEENRPLWQIAIGSLSGAVAGSATAALVGAAGVGIGISIAGFLASAVASYAITQTLDNTFDYHRLKITNNEKVKEIVKKKKSLKLKIYAETTEQLKSAINSSGVLELGSECKVLIENTFTNKVYELIRKDDYDNLYTELNRRGYGNICNYDTIVKRTPIAPGTNWPVFELEWLIRQNPELEEFYDNGITPAINTENVKYLLLENDVYFPQQGNHLGNIIYLDKEKKDLKTYGMLGDDLIFGTDENDIIYGDLGDAEDVEKYSKAYSNTTMHNDVLVGNEGNDALYGEDDNDTLIGDKSIYSEDELKQLINQKNSIIDNDFEFENDGNDYLDGGEGEDLLIGGGGNDVLIGGEGEDTLYGGSGKDLLIAGDTSKTQEELQNILNNNASFSVSDFETDSSENTLHGGTGDDIIIGDKGDDTMYGDADNDVLFGGDGNDEIYGDDENNVYTGNDVLIGGNGNDELHGGNGNDVIIAGNTSLSVDSLKNLSAIQNSIDASAYQSQNGGENKLYGNAGNDILIGDKGDDILDGGSDADYMYGGDGNDTYIFDDDSNMNTDNVIEKANEGDSDTIDFSNVSSAVDVDLTQNSGKVFANNSDVSGIENIYGTNSNDKITGQNLNNVLVGNEGNDTLSGGAGDDVLIAGTAKKTPLLSEERKYTNEELLQIISEKENINSNDFESENGGTNELHGGEDDDLLIGDKGDDTLYGESGNDYLYGGKGNDVLLGGAGSDHLKGEDGNDILIAGETSLQADQIKNLSINSSINVSEFETSDGGENVLYGGSGNDILIGDKGNDTLYGDIGDDIIYGGKGSDTINGDEGEDILVGGEGSDEIVGGRDNDILIAGETTLSANAIKNMVTSGTIDLSEFETTKMENNTLSGGSGNDVLIGDIGNDEIYGETGNDIIFGGKGNDFLDGGYGNDIIVSGEGVDKARGGNGEDILIAGNTNLSVTAIRNLANQKDRINVNQFESQNGDDTTLQGDSGNDLLIGDKGNDTLKGGSNDDYIYGGKGDDVLLGGTGTNYLYGGKGNDEYHLTAGSKNIIQDTDNCGAVFRGNRQLCGADKKAYKGNNTWVKNGIKYQWNESSNILIINNGLATIKNFKNGALGITLEKPEDEPEPPEKADNDMTEPIVLDLDGNGFGTTNVSNGVYFDFNNDGFAEKIAWADDGDGVLVADLNNNGKIDNGTEVLTAETLSSFDTNNDGVINSEDENFANLKIMKNDGTVLSLADAGVESINTNITETDYTDENENFLFGEGSFIKTDGTINNFGEYYFKTDYTDTEEVDLIEETEAVAALPDIENVGKLRSLHQAMLRDENLQMLVSNFVSETNDTTRMEILEQMIFKWAGCENIEINSRGIYVNSKNLALWEAINGKDFISSNEGEDNPTFPNEEAASLIETEIAKFKNSIYAQLMQQTHLKTYYDAIDKTEIQYDLTPVINLLDAQISQNEAVGKDLVYQVAKMLKGLDLIDSSNFFDAKNDNCFYLKYTTNDRNLKWLIDSIGEVYALDITGEGEGTSGDDLFMTEEDEDGHFHSLWGNDVLYGNNDFDSFYSCAGNDIVDGGDGDDEIFAGEGNDIVFGGAGNDQLYGAWGDDTIFGGDGDDTIYPDQVDNVNGYGAGEGNDIIRGDKGNDTIYSDLGDDTFIFNLGDGQDTVYEKQGVDTFYFGNGIAWSDLTFEQSGDDMIIKINNTTDQITVKDWFLTTGENYKYDNNKIEIFEFADGSKHYKDEITVGDNTESIVYNMSDLDSDYIETANDYKTTVNLKSGWNHIVAGENSNDTYVFTEQGTDALIVNYSGNNTIKFGNGITLENTVFERREDGLNISFNDFDGHISIEGDIGTFANFEFADGTVITDIKNYLRSDIAETDYEMGTNTEELTLVGYEDISATGNDLDNTIRGNEGDTTFEGKGGNDYLESLNGGNDTYIFNLGDGADTIQDLGGNDTIKFGEGITLENISFLRNFANNALEISFNVENHYNDRIIIENFFGSGNNKIEKFVFADNTEITDVTSYISTHIYESDFVLPSNIQNGTIWGWEHVSATGNDLDNGFSGNSGDNTFNGGLGNDSYWDGIGGNERYIYNLGDGNDFIEDTQGLDAIIFGIGITKDNIIFSRNEENNGLEITFKNQEGSIFIANYFNGDENKIELFKFADGSVIDNIASYLDSQIENIQNGSIVMDTDQISANISGNADASVLGNSLDNNITGNAGNNTYAAGGGDDTITDILGGNDTYLYNIRNGHDIITDLGGVDTIKFGSDFYPDNLKFERIENNLLISFEDWIGGSLTINNYFLNDEYKIENFVFNDGTVLTDISDRITGVAPAEDYTIAENTIIDTVRMTGSNDITVTGNNNDNTIYGNSGNNTFVGKGGNDTLIDHNGGNDTYIYNLGDGFDYIKDVGGNDTIKFGEGITLDNLAFKQTATDLEIWFQFEEGGLVIENFFSNPDNKIERFELADGTVITDISNYITAIGSDGDIVLPSGVQQALLSGSNDATITGNNLDNWLSGNSGNNTFNGGQGNDFIVDESDSDDTYIYNLGDGYDTIHDHGGFDKIKFGAGITKENLVFVRQTDGNLIINFVNENGEFLDGNICIKDYFNNEDNKIEKIEFADGSSIYDIESKVKAIAGDGDISNWYGYNEIRVWGDGDSNIYGSVKDEIVYGGSGNNTYQTFDGTDYIYDTNGGNDTYVFDDASSIKYILDIGGDEDTIKLTCSASQDDTMFVRNGNNLRIYFRNRNNNFIQIEDYFVDDEHKIEKCEFADGTVITDLSNYITGYAKEDDITLSGNNKSAILLGKDDLSVIGSSNDDYIRGNSGDNTYTGGAGDDTIEDRTGGNDTYVYNWGDGNDCIMDIGGEDTIRFGESITLGNLSFENCNGDLKIEIRNEDGDYGSIFVVNHFKSDYRKIEHIELADGTVIDDLTPYITGTTVKTDYTIGEDSPIKNIYMQGKKNISVVGNSLDNNFSGNSGNNTFEGKGGNDNYWDEAGGNDTYIYNAGDGFDWIHDKFGYDTIRLGEGITASMLTMNRWDDGQLEITFDGVEGNIVIDNYFNDDDNKIEKIILNDGTEITDFTPYFTSVETDTNYAASGNGKIQNITAIGSSNITLIGNSNNNTISGNSGNNTFEGKGGDDRLVDNQGGNDTYIYNLGDGNDTINDVGGIDTIKFGAGIALENLAFMQTSDNLNIWFHNQDGGISIENYFTNPDNKIERFELADGTVITDITNHITAIGSNESIVLPDGVFQAHLWGDGNTSATGNSLDNWLGGNLGNNTFEGKGGNDYFCDEQGGNDTYIYNLGDGYDCISDTNGNDTIQFGTGITTNNVSFNQTAEGNLEIRFGEEEGSIVIEDYFNVNTDKKIENFAFSDGTTLSDISSLIIPYAETNSAEEYVDENTVNSIIQEMSAYAPDGEMAIGEYNQNSEELLQLVAC